MGIHSRYVLKIMDKIEGFSNSGEKTEVRIDNVIFGRIDGVVDNKIAVEIESRVFKQIRGAMLDLIIHEYRKKLLLLLPVHMSNPEQVEKMSKKILARFLNSDDFRVVLLQGTGERPKFDADLETIHKTLEEWRMEK